MTRTVTTTTTKTNYYLRVLVVLVELAVAMSWLVEEARPAKAAFPGVNGKKIAFTSHRQSNTGIYLVSVSSREQRRLTTNPNTDFVPNWQPLVN